MSRELIKLPPKEIVKELDKYIIGQNKAKKSVAIALRNRLRRSRIPEEIRDEIAPRNIIMIGSTGVGKTEIARRLAKLSGAPFIKVEATKFTEVGYVGRDVESMVRDLMSAAVSMVKSEMRKDVESKAKDATEDMLLDLLLPAKPETAPKPDTEGNMPAVVPKNTHTREVIREKLKKGELEDKKIEISVSQSKMPMMEVFSGSGMEGMDLNMGAFSTMFGGGKKVREVTVKQAREILMNDQVDKMIDDDSANEMAKERIETMGIIFIDEIDKIAVSGGHSGGGVDVSREGVQRDILPIVEGSNVNTKYGMIDTSHILFIAAGAFNLSKPSDLIPELQGRFPLRVELEDLGADEFERILNETKHSLIKQYVALLKTEDVTIEFEKKAIRRISEIAEEANNTTENIGARRLYTVMEILLEEISFESVEMAGKTIKITPEYVDERLSAILEDRDLSQFIL